MLIQLVYWTGIGRSEVCKRENNVHYTLPNKSRVIFLGAQVDMVSAPKDNAMAIAYTPGEIYKVIAFDYYRALVVHHRDVK